DLSTKLATSDYPRLRAYYCSLPPALLGLRRQLQLAIPPPVLEEEGDREDGTLGIHACLGCLSRHEKSSKEKNTHHFLAIVWVSSKDAAFLLKPAGGIAGPFDGAGVAWQQGTDVGTVYELT
ncbi:hypothetical protein DXG03_005088, partial [Asterophora parasitica]